MIDKSVKPILYLIMLFIAIQAVSAANMTMQQLIDSFDYNYYTGNLNVTNQTDYMIDTNSNGLNDTLIINITTDNATSDNYTFIVEILDQNGILINDTSTSINSTSRNAIIGFSTSFLSQSKFNYTLTINDVNGTLIFRKYKTETNTYSNYEAGTNVTRLTDESINNNFIRINLTINSTQTTEANITVTLAYNSSRISKAENKSLINGVQVVSIDFDNETIKLTHYVGNFTIDSVVVGIKTFDFNQNTSIYNYEDFAKISYMKSIIDSRVDLNSNNLSEFLEINFTINVKTSDTYNLTYDLYDQFDNFVLSYNTSRTLALGNQTVQTLINGSELYKTKINGPYVLSFVKLFKGNDTKDIIFNAYTTNQSSYTDYERPPLPDLYINMTIAFNGTTNTTNITINLSNLGEVPAFNIFIDVFDNNTYSINRSLESLKNGEYTIYNLSVTNTTNKTIFTAIVDFDNVVDEKNESNNIVQNSPNIVSLRIDSITTMYTNGTLKIFEFVILNDGDATVTDVQWWFDTNDSNIINSTSNISSMAVNEKAFVYIQYNFSDEGSYNVKANATGLSQSTTISSSLSSTVGVGDIAITSFDDVNIDVTKVIFEVQAQNNLLFNLTNLNWSLTTGNSQIINSTSPFNVIASNETVFIFVQHDYGASGTFNPTASVTNGTYSDSKSITFDIKHIEAFNLSVVNESGSKRMFEFIIKNNLNQNLTSVNWTFDTKNNTIINATISNILQPNEQMFIYIDYNFTGNGTFNTNVTAINGSLSDSRNLTIIV